jgi:hypothetical protein
MWLMFDELKNEPKSKQRDNRHPIGDCDHNFFTFSIHFYALSSLLS